MVIIETSIFTRQVLKFLSEDEYQKLQTVLINRPDAAPIMKGSGGLRKMRWSMKGQGKRGGIRVIYYWVVKEEKLLMLFMYPKTKQDDLTSEQLKILRQIVEDEYP